jgi:hypothetical protein
MHTLYLGPSWAVQSFETPLGNDAVKTNLAKELNLQNYVDLSRCGDSNMNQLSMAKQFLQENQGPARAVFITSNSLQDSETLLDTPIEDFARYFMCQSDPVAVIKTVETKFYQHLCDLNIPVALIGAHTDIVDYAWPDHITVIHASWQNFLLEQGRISTPRFFGWAAEVAHRWLHNRIEGRQGPEYTLDLEVPVSNDVVFCIDQAFTLWSKLERRRLWSNVHPNIRGNELFAQAIGDLVNQWLEKTKNIVYT